MRSNALYRSLAAICLAATPLTACQAGAPTTTAAHAGAPITIDSREGGTAMAVFAAELPARRVLAGAYTRADVHHVRLELLRLADTASPPIAVATVSADALDRTVTFSHLKVDRAYRVRATAYAADDTVISEAAASYVDFTVDAQGQTSFNRVPIQLVGGAALSSAGAAPGLNVVDGGYMAKGHVAILSDAGSAGYFLGMGVDGAGNVYVVDQAASRLYTYSVEGALTQLPIQGLSAPCDVAVAADGTIYIAHEAGIAKVAPGGSLAEPYGGGLGLVNGLAIGPDGALYASTGQQIYRIPAGGSPAVFAGNGQYGAADGDGGAASFSDPFGLAFDSQGQLYVADAGNGRIRRITANGTVSTVVRDLVMPTDVAVSSNGLLYFTDGMNGLVQRCAPGGTPEQVAGGFYSPGGIALGPQGLPLVSDINRLCKIY